jgi:hypothetical protein
MNMIASTMNSGSMPVARPAAAVLMTLAVHAVIAVTAASGWADRANAQIVDTADEAVAGIPANYTEAEVGRYDLPDPLRLDCGERVTDAASWYAARRPEIVALLEAEQFGRAPGAPDAMVFDVFDPGTPAFDGRALRKQVTIYFADDRSDHYVDLLIYLPAAADGPVPLLLQNT